LPGRDPRHQRHPQCRVDDRHELQLGSATARIESSRDPAMTTGSSSASGLFQFIDQTWFGTLERAGPALVGDYAIANERDASGQWVVPVREMRSMTGIV
jgi:hypothetical protein